MQRALSRSGAYLARMGDEALEEYLQAILDPALRNVMLGENNELKLFSEQAMYNALTGALTAAVANLPYAMSGTMSGTPEDTADLWTDAGDSDTMEEWAMREGVKGNAVDSEAYQSYAVTWVENEAKRLGYGTLDNRTARQWYLDMEAQIPRLIQSEGSVEQQARLAVSLRNQARTQARLLMQDRELAESLNRTDPNLTWEQVYQKYYDKGHRGDDIYREIIKAAQRSRDSVNKSLGLKGHD